MLDFIKQLLGLGQSVDFGQLVQEGAVIIDVRTPSEYNSGHIKGAENIPLNEIGKRINYLKQKNKTVITCCRSGNRSAMAASQLKQAGITSYNGGAWNALQQKISK